MTAVEDQNKDRF